MSTTTYVGNIILDYTGRRADWIRVENGRIADFGLGDPPKKDKVVKLDGYLLPGFIDGHTHIFKHGLSLMWVDLRGVKSIEEMKRRLRNAKPFMGWILGRGWDQDKMVDGRYPTKEDLDEISRETPIYLKRVCGHIAVANSKALELAGITRDTPDPPGGVIDREGGEPTGVLRETALQLVEKVIPQPDRETLLEAVYKAFEDMLSRGVTSAHLVSATPEEWEALKMLREMGKLPMRIRVYMDHRYLDWAIEKGFRMGFGDDMLRFMGIKVISDGSLGGRTAYLREPYADDPSTKGVLVVPLEELRRIVKTSFTHGFQMAVHGIGDAAIENILKVYNEVIGGEVSRRRDRIEHASIMPPDLVEMALDMDVHISTQPQFITSDTWVVDRLGEDRARYAYPLKTLHQAGLNLGFGSDCPVEIPDPRMGLYAAMTRGGDSIPLGALTPSERLTPSEAIKGYTLGAALMSHDRLGVLDRGYPFDAVELSIDPFKADPNEVLHAKILSVYVDGVRRYPL